VLRKGGGKEMSKTQQEQQCLHRTTCGAMNKDFDKKEGISFSNSTSLHPCRLIRTL
jgi:hypothetical protein